MAVELASAYVTIIPSLRGATGQIQKELGGVDTSKAGSKIGAQLSSNIGRSLNLKTIGAKFQQIGGQITGVGQKLTSSITKPAIVAGGAVAGLVGGLGFKRLVGIDTARSQFQGLGLDADKVMEQVDKGVTNTSLSMADGASSAVGILATGAVPLKGLEGQIKRVANVSAAYGVETTQANMLLNNVLTKNKVEWGDLSQMMENGIPITKLLSDSMGVAQSSIQDMASEGKISVEDLNKAIDQGAGKAAESYASSFKGITANIKSNLGRVGAAVLEPMFNQLKPVLANFLALLKTDEVKAFATTVGEQLGNAFTKLVTGVQAVVKWFTGLSPQMQKTVLTIGGLAIAAGPVITVIGKLTTGLGTVFGVLSKVTPLFGKAGGGFKLFSGAMKASPIAKIVTVVAALAAGLVYFFTKTKAGQVAMEQLKAVFASLGPVFQQVMAAMKPVIAQIGQMWQQIAAQLMPVFQQLISEIMPPIMDLITQLAPIIASLVTTILPPLVDLIMQVAQVITQVVAAIAPLIAEFVEGLIPVIVQVIQALTPLITTIMEAVVPAFQQILQVVTTVFNAIKPIIDGALQVITGIMKTVMAVLKGDWKGAWDGIKQILSGVWEIIKGVVKAAMTAVKSVITTVLGAIKGVWNKVWGAIKSFASTVWGGIKSAVSGAINSVKSTVSSVMSSIKSAWSTAWTAMKTKVSEIWTGIKTGVQDGINAVMTFVNGIKAKVTGAFTGAGKWLWDAGRKVVQGFIDGLKSLWDKVQGWFKKLTKFIPKWKGPPSTDKTLLTNAGELVMTGFINGLESQRSAVKSSLEDITDMISDVMEDTSTTTQLGVDTVASYTATAFTTRHAVPDYGDDTTSSAGMLVQGPLIQVQNLTVDSDNRVKQISQDLFTRANRAARANGGTNLQGVVR
ncbi:MAG: phage tail protein [Galactobacter sp.]